MDGWIFVHDLDPVLVHLGPLRVGWYGLMYALSFLVGYWACMRTSRYPGAVVTEEQVPAMVTYLILGVVLGGRLGWVLFYGGAEYLFEPWRILETWKGGMSFHGGLLGVLAAWWLFSYRYGIGFLDLAGFCITWVPLGLFFGRIGNFINGELYGMRTDGSWGVIFTRTDPALAPRHPSQLYEAVLEGLVIFAALWVIRFRLHRPRLQGPAFLFLYGLARIAVEFVRLPDAHIGYLWAGFVTMGQLLSLPMALVGLAWLAWELSRDGGGTGAGATRKPRRA